MMSEQNWRKQLKTDPVPVLLASQNEAIIYFVKRDLLNEQVGPISVVWELPAPQKLIRKQQDDGSWIYTGKKMVVYPEYHYSLFETFKRFRILVEQYEFNREYPEVNNAAEYLFSCQTEDGDIRGMIGNQYATYYTGIILSLLIKAGYEDDPRIEKGIHWLLSMRQDDGGWTIPILTHKIDTEDGYYLTSQYAAPVEPDRTKPFSHNWTNMVLQAFAAHSRYRELEETRIAGTLLKSRFFQPDGYASYRAPGYWVRFAFWWPNLLTALDSLSLIGFTKEDSDIKKALDWFIKHQETDGLWKVSYVKDKDSATTKNIEERLWLSLKICQVLNRILGSTTSD